jgi:hypothetical protein
MYEYSGDGCRCWRFSGGLCAGTNHPLLVSDSGCSTGERSQAVQYRCVATTLEGFVQQLAVCYVGRGYWHYVTGLLPGGKSPPVIDAKLVAKYGIGVPKWTRSRRMKLGRAGMQYIRHEAFFVLCATAGEHLFFREEKGNIRDAREEPIVYGGYSVGIRGGRVHVRMSDRAFGELRAYFLDVAVHRTVEELVGDTGLH